jgi:hypothetical protein
MTVKSTQQPWWLWPIVITLLVLVLPFVVVVLVLWLAASLLLLIAVWVTWCPRGRYALVVYSNSPIWQEYFEMRLLPELSGRAAVLNWSERNTWKMSLPVLLFQTFAGTREFNPVAIVFKPLQWPRRFRFYRAFQSFKHGRPEEVERLRVEFLQVLNALAKPTTV